jgi:hypothetical protein
LGNWLGKKLQKEIELKGKNIPFTNLETKIIQFKTDQLVMPKDNLLGFSNYFEEMLR